MAPAMSLRIAVWGIGFTLILLLVSSAQAVDYERHRHDVISASRGDVILTSRDFLEQLNFVAPKASYTSQEATEHLLHFGALLRARILDTFGSLLYDYYDDFGMTEVEALHKVYRKIFERQYDIFDLVPSVLRNQDTRPSRICAEIYNHARHEPCLRSSASVCRRIRKQHDLPNPDDRNTPALNITYRVYRLSKISEQYPRGFSPATLLRLLQREVLMITPTLLSGLLYNVRYESYDDDVRLAERELVRHFYKISETSEISVSTNELNKFHTMNSFLKYFFDTYAEKLPDNALKKYTLLIARRIADDVGTIDENIQLLGNVYENRTVQVGYLFDLVLPDDILENDIIEAKRYLVKKLNKFNVVERYLRVQKYQQASPAQLTMEITGQLRDINFAKSIATSLRMHAKFWHTSRMIESLDELLELFDTYENLRQVPRYKHMMQKIDGIKESLLDMKDIPVEILCNTPRACLRIGLQLILECKFISSSIKDSIKDFLELSDVCVDIVEMIQESRRSVEIPFTMSKTRYTTLLHTTGMTEFTTRRSTPKDHDYSKSYLVNGNFSIVKISNKTIKVPMRPKTTKKEFTSSTTVMTTPRTTTELTTPISMTPPDDIVITTMSTTTAATTPSPTTITTLPTTTTKAPTTELTTLPTTTLSTTTTMLPTTTTASPTTTITTTTLPTTTTTISPTTTTTTLPTTTTTTLPTTTTTTLPTTTTTALPTTITTASPTTITTASPTTITTASPTTTTTASPTTTTTASPTTITTASSTTITTASPTTITTASPTTISTTLLATTTTAPSTTISTTLPTTTTTTLPTTTSTTLPTETTTTSPATLPATITTTLATTTTTSPTITAELPNVKLELERSRITQIYADEVINSSTAIPMKTCEFNECNFVSKRTSKRVETTILLSSTQSPSTTQTTQPTIPEITQTETTVSSTTEMSEPPVTKGDDCAKICLEGCGFKSESIETSRRSCETSCDSTMEDCNEDSTPKDSQEMNSPECGTKVDRSCGCVTECMTLCPPSPPESSSCEEGQSDCIPSVVPTFDMKLKRTRTRSMMCEIRDPYHRRQLRRLAKMRALSSSAAVVATSRVDVPRLRTSRHRDRIMSKKRYNLLATKPYYTKSRKVADYLHERPLSGRLSGNDRDRRRRKQREHYELSGRLTRKLDGKSSRKTTMHRTRRITPFRHHSQIKRISERVEKSISA